MYDDDPVINPYLGLSLQTQIRNFGQFYLIVIDILCQSFDGFTCF